MSSTCVVIAEDYFVLRKVVVDYLATFGITCIEPASEAETWLALQRNPVDALVLDLILSSARPTFSIVERMQKDSALREVPIIVTSAYSGDALASVDRGGYLAVCSFLQKPYDLSQLRYAIIRAIAESRNTMTPSVG